MSDKPDNPEPGSDPTFWEENVSATLEQDQAAVDTDQVQHDLEQEVRLQAPQQLLHG